MCKLDANFLALGVCEFDNLLERGNLFVGPESRVVGRDAPLGEDRGGFGESEAGPACASGYTSDSLNDLRKSV